MGKANKALNVQGAVANRSKQFLERLFESFKQNKRSCWRKISGTKPQNLPYAPIASKRTSLPTTSQANNNHTRSDNGARAQQPLKSTPVQKPHISCSSSFHFINPLSNAFEEPEGGIYDDIEAVASAAASSFEGHLVAPVAQRAVQQAEHGPLPSAHTLERGTSALVQDDQDIALANTLNKVSQEIKSKTKPQGIVVPSKDRSKYFLPDFDDPEEVNPPEDATLEDICWNFPNHLTKDKYLDMFTTRFWSARDKFARTRPEVQAQWKRVRGADDAWNFLQKRADKRDVELGPERVRALVEGPKAASRDGYEAKRNPLNLGLNSNAAKRKSNGERTEPEKRQRTRARVAPEEVAETAAPRAVEAHNQPNDMASGAVANDPQSLPARLPVDTSKAETVPAELAELFAEDFLSMCERNLKPFPTLEEPLGACFGLTFWSSTMQFERLMASLCTSLQETWEVARFITKRNTNLDHKDARSIILHLRSLCGWPLSCVNGMFAHFDQLPGFHASSFNTQMEQYERFIQGNLRQFAATLIKGFVFDHLLVFGEEAFCERMQDLLTAEFVRFMREGCDADDLDVKDVVAICPVSATRYAASPQKQC